MGTVNTEFTNNPSPHFLFLITLLKNKYVIFLTSEKFPLPGELRRLLPGLFLEAEGVLLEAQWILSTECRGISEILSSEGRGERQEVRLRGRPAPVVEGLECHSEGFGLFLRNMAAHQSSLRSVV